MYRHNYRLLLLAGLCWALAGPSAPAQKGEASKSDSATKPVIITEKVPDMKVPESFFAPEVVLADRNGPFVFAGRNGAPNESRSLFDLRSGKEVATLKGKHELHKPEALSPDGKLLAASAGPFKANDFTIIELATGKTLQVIKSDKRVELLEWLDNDRVVSAFNWENQFTVWDAKTGKSLTTFKTGRRAGNPAISPDGKTLAVAEDVNFKKTMQLYDLKSGQKGATLPLPEAKPFGYGCEALAFSVDGKHLGGLFKNGGQSTVLAWQVDAGKVTAEFPVTGPFKNVFFNGQKFQWSPDGKAWLLNGEIVTDVETGKTIWKADPAFGGACRIVAANQIVGFVEKDRQRRIASVSVTPEQVEAMTKVARSGGQASDALLPKLTDADLAAGKQIDVPVGAVALTYKPDAAGDASKLAPRPVPLGCSGKEIESLQFPAASAGIVIIEMKDPAHAPFQPAPKATALERYSLTSGKKLGRFDLKFPAKLAGVSPDGKQVLLIEAEQAGRLDLWNFEGDTPEHVAGFRPYAKEADEKNRKMTFAALTGPGRVLTANAAGKVVSWSLPTCKAEWVADVRNFVGLKLTPGGKYLAGLDRDIVRLFDVATGAPSGDLDLPQAFPAGNKDPKAVAVSADGKQAAGLWLVQPEGGPGPIWAIARWDLTSGKALDAFPFRSSIFVGNVPAFNFAGTEHLLVDNTYLIDLARKEVTWTYRLAGFDGKHAARPLDGRHWYALSEFNQPTATLVAAALPESGVGKYVEAIEKGNALLKPGTGITVLPELKGEQADRVQNAIVANAQKAIAAVGFKAEDNAAAVLTLKATERDTGDTIEFRKLFPDIRKESPFARTQVKLMEVDCVATLAVNGQAVWQAKEKLGMRTFGILRLPEGEKDVGRFLRTRMWDGVSNWALRASPPRFVTRTSEGILALPGTSQLKADGPATQVPRVQIGK